MKKEEDKEEGGELHLFQSEAQNRFKPFLILLKRFLLLTCLNLYEYLSEF